MFNDISPRIQRVYIDYLGIIYGCFSSNSSLVTEMAQYLQQKYFLVVVLNCIQLCLGIQCEGK